MTTYQFDFTVITDGDTEGDALEEAMQLLADYRFAKEAATVTVLDDICPWPEGDCVHPTPDPIGNHMADASHPDHVPTDSPMQRIAALSADLRLLVESDDDYVDDAMTMECATDLLDAIDQMLGK